MGDITDVYTRGGQRGLGFSPLCGCFSRQLLNFFFFFSFIFQDRCNNWLFFSVSESTHTVYTSLRNDHLLQSRTLSTSETTENILKHREDEDRSLLLFVQSFLIRHVDPCDLQTSSPASVLLRGRTHILKKLLCCNNKDTFCEITRKELFVFSLAKSQKGNCCRYHAFIFTYIYVVSTLGQMMGLPSGLTSANY